MHKPVWNLHHRRLRHYFSGFLISLFFSGTVYAEATALAIHVRADDAKFIGSGTSSSKTPPPATCWTAARLPEAPAIPSPS